MPVPRGIVSTLERRQCLHRNARTACRRPSPIFPASSASIPRPTRHPCGSTRTTCSPVKRRSAFGSALRISHGGELQVRLLQPGQRRHRAPVRRELDGGHLLQLQRRTPPEPAHQRQHGERHPAGPELVQRHDRSQRDASGQSRTSPTTRWPWTSRASIRLSRPSAAIRRAEPTFLPRWSASSARADSTRRCSSTRQRNSTGWLSEVMSYYGLGFGNQPIPFSDLVANYSNGTSDYSGLTVNVKKRFSQHYELLASYTWSHSIDDSTDLEATLEPQDNFHPNLDRSNFALRSAPALRHQRRLSERQPGQRRQGQAAQQLDHVPHPGVGQRTPLQHRGRFRSELRLLAPAPIVPRSRMPVRPIPAATWPLPPSTRPAAT